MNEPDDMLIEQAAQGDHAALEALVRRHGPTVRSRLERAMPARWRASFDLDDVMQETYADAILAIHRFVPAGPIAFVAWLVTLGRNNILNAVRGLEADKRGGGRRRIDAFAGAAHDDSCLDLFERLGGRSSTASRDVARREAGIAVREAIASLPEPHRSVVRMHDLEGRPVAAIAVEIDRTPGAVCMLRARSLRLLADQLGAASRYLSGRG